jgi:hypothetical protein
VLCSSLVALVLFGSGGWFAVHGWYHTALQRITHQIQGVIDQEAQALFEQDVGGFLAQQDSQTTEWFARQVEGIQAERMPADGGTSAASLYDRLPGAQVRSVQVMGDMAWVEVVPDRRLVRQVRFFRLTERGWKHTAPDVAFWGDPVEIDCGDVVVHCHERDRPYVEPLTEHILRAHEEHAVLLGSGSGTVLEVQFKVEVPMERMPAISGSTLALPSPWLSGVPVEDSYDQEYLTDLAWWVVCTGERMLTTGQLDSAG